MGESVWVAFLAARYAEEWSAARDRELVAGLDTSRATRDVDAKRALLALYEEFRAESDRQCNDPVMRHGGRVGPGIYAATNVLHAAVRQFAAVYEDHPDYPLRRLSPTPPSACRASARPVRPA